MKILDPQFETIQYQNNLANFFSEIHENSPIFTTSEKVIYLSAYDDCQRLLQDDMFIRRPEGSNTTFALENKELTLCESMIEHWIVFQDPPYHTRLRNTFNSIFTPKAINELRPAITQIAQKLIADFPKESPFDFIDAVAFPFPILVIAEFFAIPDIDLKNFKEWSYLLTLGLNTGGAENFLKADHAIIQFQNYFNELFSEREHKPGNDLFSVMIKAFHNNELSYEEIIDTSIFLIWAGHETTKLLISNGLLLLLTNPAQCDYFFQHPDCTKKMIEEILRVESPIQKISRWASSPCQFQGINIEKNSFITALLGAANRDPKVFHSPDEFLINRTETKNLAFGKGIHHCLGAYLARMEGEIIFDLLRTYLPSMQLLDYAWRQTSSFRCLDQLIIQIMPSEKL